MLDLISGCFASIASLFSGSSDSKCIMNIWADVECPKELIK